MLKINKILSKKIKSPLSLRGLFPFCHSRESGNPSPLSLRGVKQQSNLNHNGFSLIELMIAVAILALAIFGIFHAYSVGFLGMADARDRTVATNYAREAMEDVKNMDFEKIATTTKSVITSNRKYRVDVNVSLESTNLKKVYTIVSWKDKNGIGKTVETTMLVHSIEVYAFEAAKIVLFADSYTILNTGSGQGTFTELTAVIKDSKGNTVIDWGESAGEGNIYFSELSGGYLGDLSSVEVTPIDGVAKTTFSSSGLLSEQIDYAVIEALVTLPNGSNISDTVTIKVTDGPVKIILSANPYIIKASTENYSTITVSLCNAANQILKKSELVTDVEITFSFFGEGNLYTSTITIPAIGEELASDEIILNSTSTPGLASVVATANDLESDTVDVRFLGPPVSILITASPNPIYVDDIEGSIVTVSLLDVNGFPTNPTEAEGTTLVNFALLPNTNGSLSPSYLTFTANEYEGIPLTTLFSGQTSTDPVTITTENAVGLIEDSVTINILSELVPDHIELIANPQNVAAGGTSIITATVYDVSGKRVSNYSGTITFSTDFGTFSIDPPEVYTTNGMATIDLSYGSAKTVTVVATDSLDSTITGSVEVGFYGEADHITLTAIPKHVKVNGVSTSTITATVCDLNNLPVSNYSGTITFSTDFGTFSIDPPEVYTTNGMATIDLSYGSAKTVTVVATDSLDSTITGSVEVIFYVVTTLELIADSAKYYPADLEVVFEVMAVGEDILLDEMGISWEPNASTERFQKIVINSEEVYIGNNLSSTIVDIEDKTLVAGESYIVKLTFGKDVDGKIFVVTFFPYTGSYEVGFTPTTQ